MNYQKLSAYCLLILTVIAVTATLMYLRTILVPFVLSVFLFISISPQIDYLQKRLKTPYWAALLLSMVIGTLSVLGLGLLITMSVRELYESIPMYEQQFAELVQTFEGFIDNRGMRERFEAIAGEFNPARAFSILGGLTTEFMGFLGNFFLILIFLLFFLTSKASVKPAPAVVKKVVEQVSRYVSLKFMISLVTGVFVGITLAFLGLEMASMFGVLAFLFNFIPNIGSIVVTFLPMPLALLQFGLGWRTLLIFLLPGAAQVVVGFIEPKFFGHQLDLHPVAILFFLLFWGIVWGIPGMFLAVPIMASLKLVMLQFKPTQPVAEVLAGRW